MKKLFIFFVFVSMCLANVATAQVWHVYDSDAFSVMFTCGDDNQIGSLQFSSKVNGKWQWNDFNVHDYADLEDTDEGGFIFYCIDGKGDYYAVDYYRDRNYIIVHSCDSDLNYTGTEWNLSRRKN